MSTVKDKIAIFANKEETSVPDTPEVVLRRRSLPPSNRSSSPYRLEPHDSQAVNVEKEMLPSPSVRRKSVKDIIEAFQAKPFIPTFVRDKVQILYAL